MKKSAGVLLAVLIALFFSLGDVSAGEISLQIQAGSTYRDGNVMVFTEITNRGTTDAQNIWVEAEAFGRTHRTDQRSSLLVTDVYQESLPMGEQPDLRGVYTIIIRIHYEDGNGHPFSVLSFIPFISVMPESLDDSFTATVAPVTIRKKQDVCITIEKEREGTGITADLRLFLPDEIECDASSFSMDFKDDEERTFDFEIYNRSSVAGSIYSCYVIIDYELDGIHRSMPVQGRIEILDRSAWPTVLKSIAIAVMVCSVLFLLLINITKRVPHVALYLSKVPYIDAVILAGIFVFTLYELHPGYLFMDTTTAGGDVAAHNYLASHLKEQLFENGRLISWSHDWWCGFPMFQYYFCLPYLMIALMDCIIPFNIAFKIIVVLGILALPTAAYFGARIMRAPRPVPIIAAIMMVPYLFVRSHTMWGVSAYSTLAGMIANSISFPLMIMFIASAFRDSDRGRFRARSVILFALLMASHFFTSIIAALVVLVFPLLKPASGSRKSFTTLAVEALLGLGLMAWWIIPLIAKNEFAVEFGTNWVVPLWSHVDSFPYLSIAAFPSYALIILPFVAYGLYRGMRDGDKFVAISLCMFGGSTFLFLFGFQLVSHVFVNIRLWPFMFYSFLMIAAYGVGRILRTIKGGDLACVVLLLMALVFGVEKPNEADDWAKWNFEGVESKKSYSVLKDLVMPLEGTPGRLANDLSAHNDKALGSSRVFELVPHMIGKPILEGGIVNSAIGSHYSYYIQGETSESCAGFPSIVEPTSFNFTNATKHLELFNIKHFIARWENTKQALAESEDWRLVKRSTDWDLYELTTHDGSYVVIPENYPVALRTSSWKQAGLDWIYDEDNLPQLYILLRDDEPLPVGVDEAVSMGHTKLSPTGAADYTVSVSEYSSERIVFKTDAVGLPHLIKCTYYPNWKMKGGGPVHMVTPSFMLVYPQSEDVELYYGSLFSDTAGRLVTAAALLFLILYFIKRYINVRSKQSA